MPSLFEGAWPVSLHLRWAGPPPPSSPAPSLPVPLVFLPHEACVFFAEATFTGTLRVGAGASQGVGEAMAKKRVPKIFLLNGSHDRETSACPGRPGLMRASDCVMAICNTLNRCESHGGVLHNPVTSYVTAVLVPAGSTIEVDQQELAALGIRCVISSPMRLRMCVCVWGEGGEKAVGITGLEFRVSGYFSGFSVCGPGGDHRIRNQGFWRCWWFSMCVCVWGGG
jgi:hypothetical protein